MSLVNLSTPEIWFVCGSQHLYGPGPLKQVAANAQKVAEALAASRALPLKTRFKALLTTPDEITSVMLEANTMRRIPARCAEYRTLNVAVTLLWNVAASGTMPFTGMAAR